ncbi:MAG: hypothetical protein BWX66_01427 [Deltaproteobacteria bacterium ADurb.Bin058]|nr:MAG: hypothetical protein BWX66_01427 [Deltaproteobacteria bacterium ADurb.Bin058]
MTATHAPRTHAIPGLVVSTLPYWSAVTTNLARPTQCVMTATSAPSTAVLRIQTTPTKAIVSTWTGYVTRLPSAIKARVSKARGVYTCQFPIVSVLPTATVWPKTCAPLDDVISRQDSVFTKKRTATTTIHAPWTAVTRPAAPASTRLTRMPHPKLVLTAQGAESKPVAT